jgi:hypothetical protein
VGVPRLGSALAAQAATLSDLIGQRYFSHAGSGVQAV